MTDSLSNVAVPAEGAGWHPQSASGFGAEICCYDTVPPFLAEELDALYRHLNSSLQHFAFRARAQGASAYVARRDGRPLAIFLFHIGRGKITVLNEMVAIPGEEMERFARYAFFHFPAVSRIGFSLVGADFTGLNFPFQQYGHSEDIVVSLPASADVYLTSLGSKTRHNIRHQLKALSRDRPDFHFLTLDNARIERRQVLDLLELKHRNIERKGIEFGITPAEAEWLVEQVQSRGLLLAAMEGDKLCGGSLSLRLGDHYFAYVIAFEPAFGKYSLGMLCCYLAMLEKIARKGEAAHLSWGRQQYKFRLLGVQHDMANIDVYRSQTAYWRHAHVLAKNAVLTYLESSKRALLESEQRRGPGPAVARSFVGALRAIKRSAFFGRNRREPPA